jgi:hypothetical protein
MLSCPNRLPTRCGGHRLPPGIPPARFASRLRSTGLLLGTLESIAEALIKERNGLERWVSYGEFLDNMEDPKSRLARVLPDIEEVFSGFHPQERPVLWPVLVAQGLLAGLLLQLLENESDTASVSGRIEPGCLNSLSARCPAPTRRDVRPVRRCLRRGFCEPRPW